LGFGLTEKKGEALIIRQGIWSKRLGQELAKWVGAPKGNSGLNFFHYSIILKKKAGFFLRPGFISLGKQRVLESFGRFWKFLEGNLVETDNQINVGVHGELDTSSNSQTEWVEGWVTRCNGLSRYQNRMSLLQPF